MTGQDCALYFARSFFCTFMFGKFFGRPIIQDSFEIILFAKLKLLIHYFEVDQGV